MLVFADASRIDEIGQLGDIAGLLIGDFRKQSIFHVTSWISHKSKRPVKSVPAAEIFTADEGIDEGKIIAAAYSEILSFKVMPHLCLDFKDFLHHSQCNETLLINIYGRTLVALGLNFKLNVLLALH